MATRASFNHSCLKTPLHPVSRMPSPGYERSSGMVERMRATPSPAGRSSRVNSAKASRASSASGPRSRLSSATIKRPTSAGVKEGGATLAPLLSFYESIPDYTELGHLSDRDFYAKVHELRQTQRAYVSTLALQHEQQHQSKSEYAERWTAGVQGVRCVLNESRGATPVPFLSPSSSARGSPGWPKLAWGKIPRVRDDDPMSSALSSPFSSPRRAPATPQRVRPSSKTRRCRPTSSQRASPDRVHITSQRESPERGRSAPVTATRVGSARRARGGGFGGSVWDCSVLDDDWLAGGSLSEGELFTPLPGFSDSEEELLRMASSRAGTPHKQRVKNVAWREPQFTVPHPFEMTRREEDERYYWQLRRELLGMSPPRAQKTRSPSPQRRNHEVPLTSRLPLFHGILLQQELRRERQKRHSKARLMSQVRPFSFDNDDLLPPPPQRHLLRKLWQSSPELRDLSRVRGGGFDREFRARPMPHHIYSADAFLRHQEDEFIRVLRRRIRAEEMLLDSSLPPSMASRSLIPHPTCRPSTATSDLSSPIHQRRQHSAPISKSSGGRRSRAISPYEDTSGRGRGEAYSPYEARTSYETSACRSRRTRRPHSATTGSVSPIRQNLAAVLRIESCNRRRAELEAAKQREHQRNIEEARTRARVLRRRPAWRNMTHMSARRELAMKAITRREEERSRQQDHSRLMGRMMGRVLGIPTLFERQSQQQESLRYRVEERRARELVSQPRSPRKSAMCSPESTPKKFVAPVEPHISFYPGNGNVEDYHHDDEKQDAPEFCNKHESNKTPPMTSRQASKEWVSESRKNNVSLSRQASRESVHERRASIISRQSSKDSTGARRSTSVSRQNSRDYEGNGVRTSRQNSKENMRSSRQVSQEKECEEEIELERVSTPCTERAM